jgi:hypothetical protein
VWSWRPDAGAKLCGSFREVTVAKEPGHRGEHEVSRKPLRRESRRVSGSPVVPPPCFPCTGPTGAIGTRLSLRPLLDGRVKMLRKPRHFVPRECGRTPSRCLKIGSENLLGVVPANAGPITTGSGFAERVYHRGLWKNHAVWVPAFRLAFAGTTYHCEERQRRSNLSLVACGCMYCLASLAMTVTEVPSALRQPHIEKPAPHVLEQLLDRAGGDHLAVIGIGLVVLLDIVEAVEVVHHDACGFAQAL